MLEKGGIVAFGAGQRRKGRLKTFQTASYACPSAGCAAPAAHALPVLQQMPASRKYRNRVRGLCHTPCLGGKRPSENAVATQPVCFSDGLSVANRNGGGLELQFGFQPVVVGWILVSDIPRGGMILRENVGFENPTYNTSLMLRFQTASLCQPSAGCSVPAAHAFPALQQMPASRKSRNRVRGLCHTPCLGGKRPSENGLSDGLSVANRNGGGLELQFGFQPVSARHADDGEAAVEAASLDLPVVFVE